MHRYNERDYFGLIEELSAPRRVVFALLCATRLLPQYKKFSEKTARGDSQLVAELAEKLWQHVSGNQMTPGELLRAIDQCTDLVPVEEDGWDEQTQAYAEDAAAALTYAFRTAASGDTQEAVWACRRAYESVDHFAGKSLGKDGYDEQALIQHPAVQAELGRQLRDLEVLGGIEEDQLTHSIEMLRRRAEREAGTVFSG